MKRKKTDDRQASLFGEKEAAVIRIDTFRAGADARYAGKFLTDCPKDLEPQARALWLKGWHSVNDSLARGDAR